MRRRGKTLRKRTRRRRSYKQKGGVQPSKYTAVIVEPRKHKALGFVLKNILENLNNEWNVLIFHGTTNKEWLDALLAESSFQPFKERIQFESLGVENLQYPDGYNTLLKSKEFYHKIPTELFLVFQIDSMICPQYKDLIHNFLDYDYVGAPLSSAFGAYGTVGNGGFSIRRKSKMLEIIEKCPPSTEYEDFFFAHSCPDVPLKKPTTDEAKEFSIEDIPSARSFGIHKAYERVKPMMDLESQCTGITELKKLNE